MLKRFLQGLSIPGTSKLPRVFRESSIDSVLSPEEHALLELHHEHKVEEYLQGLARERFDVSIRVAVFKRQSKGGAPNLLAMLRPLDPLDATDPRLTESLAMQIVNRYNRDHRQSKTAPISVVIWSPRVKLDGEMSAPAVIYQSVF